MKDWNTNFPQRVRISQENYNRLVAYRGNDTMAKKLDYILNLYFNNKGGEVEKKKLIKKIKDL